MREIEGLAAIAARFDAAVIDQFGVIHDGRTLYPGARAALEGLARAGKRVVILTNSGKRRAANHARIVAMGIPAHLFIDVVSSGDVAFAELKGGKHGAFRRPMIIGKAGEDYLFGDLSEGFTADPANADLFIILGSDAPRTPLDDYRRMFETPARSGVPAVCCNPDRQMITAQGLFPAPGAIAAVYEELGGKVAWIGKPYPQIYTHALRLAGEPEPSRTLGIGDSLEHDVRGGHSAGLLTALVRTGIAADLAPEAIRAAQPQPDFVLPALRW